MRSSSTGKSRSKTDLIFKMAKHMQSSSSFCNQYYCYFTRGCCPRASHHVPVWKASRQNPLAPVDHSVFLPAGLGVRRHLHDGVILLGDASEVAVPCASKGPVQRGVSGLVLCLESFLQQRCLNTSSALPLPGLCWRAVPPRPGFPPHFRPPHARPLAPPPRASEPPASPPYGR